ncbi:MAG: SprB repeat-containing protein [Sphingobacteriales bacterium]|nr:SprB repeat-containing protein [Sphingobacteriales bacterium]
MEHGATTSSISGLVAGTYSVTVTDAKGCTDQCTATVDEPDCNLSASADGTPVSCHGGNNGTATATPTGNNGAVTYLWSNGATTQTISGLSAGTYTVTITDAVNCTAIASYTVTEPPVMDVTCTSTDVTTNGGSDGTASVTASGGTPPYTYLWNTGATTSSISGLVAGTYSVTVTDAKGCTAECSTTVNEPGCNLSASADGTPVSCHGGNNGTATATPTGNSDPVSYLWSNGATTQTISGLSAGTYTVTITETPTCTATASYTVTEPPVMDVTCSSTDATTNGGSDGTASVTASGGTPPYTYLWNTGATTSSISGLVAGTYSVTVTDAKGCTAECSTTVNEPGCNLSASADGTPVSCNDGSDGTATATPTGNNGAVTYLWSNGATTQSISGLSAGTYTVTITDAVNCTAIASYTVTEPPVMDVTCSSTDVTTNGGSDGTASVTASGGTPPYTYLWNTGATTSSISGLVAGTYSVTVTDAKGCTAECSTTVNEPGCNLSASADGTPVSCNDGSDGTATATPTGNNGAVTYLWSNGATTQTISGLSAGTYTVTITDAVNCTAIASYTVTEPPVMDVTCTSTDVTTNGGSDGTASVTASGGTPPYTYLWNTGATTSSISGLVAGTYSVTVTDAKGCTAECSTTVNEPGCNLSASADGTPVSCLAAIMAPQQPHLRAIATL